MEVRERKSKGRLGHLKCYEKGGARLCELTTQGMARELISTTFVSDLLTMGDGSNLLIFLVLLKFFAVLSHETLDSSCRKPHKVWKIESFLSY